MEIYALARRWVAWPFHQKADPPHSHTTVDSRLQFSTTFKPKTRMVREWFKRNWARHGSIPKHSRWPLHLEPENKKGRAM